MEFIWSNTDFPYMCLKDRRRTSAFREAIRRTVKDGNIVVEIGAGSGILSMFAVEAGAEHVYAVEIEHTLAESLRKSIAVNGLDGRISVVEGDVFKVDLPKKVDVLIAELIETGLMDELQVPAINHLKRNGVISGTTKLIPEVYTTTLQLVDVDNKYYDYEMLLPKHEWPFYEKSDEDWWQTRVNPVSPCMELVKVNFNSTDISESIHEVVDFELNSGSIANGLRIAGLIKLADGVELGATNALNGDKIIALEPIHGVDRVKLDVSYIMGGGLGTLRVQRLK